MGEFDTEFDTAYVINFVDLKGYTIFSALWGIVTIDHRKKFAVGHFVFTSNIVDLNFSSNLIKTLNTIYKIDWKKTDTIQLPASQVIVDALSAGFSPSLLLRKINDEPIH